MPDWFYRTVSQPLLFRASAPRGRDFALGFMGRLARLPLGPALIDFLGHMRPDPRLRRTVLGIDFPSPVGLGPGLDTEAAALSALARFGFGFLEVGPVCVGAAAARRPIERLTEQQAVWLPESADGLPLAEVEPRLAGAARCGVPLLVRLAHSAGASPEQAADEYCRMIRQLVPGRAAGDHFPCGTDIPVRAAPPLTDRNVRATGKPPPAERPTVQLFAVASLRPAVASRWPLETWTAHLRQVVAASPRPVLLCVPADLEDGAGAFLEAAVSAGIGGWLVDGSIAGKADGRIIGQPARGPALEVVRRLHQQWSTVPIIAAGGVHEPADALALLAAGADLVEADTGLVFTGPGLPKRINEAILHTLPAGAPDAELRPPEMSWFWTALMGAGMLFGSILALLIAATRVVLPYDEAFVGLARSHFDSINPRLLAFMAHDRVSLAGTMIAIGVMYVGLSWFGIRRGRHWAQITVFVSAFTGFASFFLFLGFGYLDTLHAFVTAVLLQLLLLAVHCRLGPAAADTAPCLRTDRAWRLSLWGQFLLIGHAAALLGAGAVICTIGVTRVFVPEDLEFMKTTAEALRAANPNLVPLVAHDRATFGGMLLSSGWVFLLPALWGFRRGTRWLWWTMLCAGVPAYVAAIGVHYAVGYTDWMHLLPAFGGFGLFLLGLALAYQFFHGRDAL